MGKYDGSRWNASTKYDDEQTSQNNINIMAQQNMNKMNQGMEGMPIMGIQNMRMGGMGGNVNQIGNVQSRIPAKSGNSVVSTDGLNILFRRVTDISGCIINVQCVGNEFVGFIIKKYRNKSGDDDPTKQFIFNAKDLDSNLIAP